MALPITEKIGDVATVLNRYFWVIVLFAIIAGVLVIGVLVYLFK